jgi:hypothetical protein
MGAGSYVASRRSSVRDDLSLHASRIDAANFGLDRRREHVAPALCNLRVMGWLARIRGGGSTTMTTPEGGDWRSHGAFPGTLISQPELPDPTQGR